MMRLSAQIGVILLVASLPTGGVRAQDRHAPLDTLIEAPGEAEQDIRYAGANIDISRKLLPEAQATTVHTAKAPKRPPRLDDPVVGAYRYHLARQAAIAGNPAGVNENMKAALDAAPDQPRYTWWRSIQAAKKLDTATLTKVLPASIRGLAASPVGRGPFVIAFHQAALLLTTFFWTVLLAALYIGHWRNLAHDQGAFFIKDPRHRVRMWVPFLLPVIILIFKPGWLGFLALLSIPVLLQTAGRVRILLLAVWFTALALVFPGWPLLKSAVPTVDPGSEVTLLARACTLPPSSSITSTLKMRLEETEDPGRKLRLQTALAIQEARRGKYERSNQIYKKVLAEDPNNFPAMVGTANNIYYLGRLDDAATWYRKASDAHPRRGEVPYNLAQVYFKKLFVPEATESLNQARSLGFSPPLGSETPTTRDGYAPVVYPPLTAAAMSAACRYEAGNYPPLVTVSSWRWLLGIPPLGLHIVVGIPLLLALIMVMWVSRNPNPRECDNCGTPLCPACSRIQDTVWLCSGCGETAERSRSDMVLATLLKNKSRAEGLAHGHRIIRLGRFIPGAGHLATNHFWSGWLRLSLLALGLFLALTGWAFDQGAQWHTPGLQLESETINPVWIPLPAALWPGWSGILVLTGLSIILLTWFIAIFDGPGLRRGISDRYSLTPAAGTRETTSGHPVGTY